MAHKKTGGRGLDRSAEATESDHTRVGYGRPPYETRFRPGQSGNPKGRPRRIPTMQETLEKLLGEQIELREGERVRRMRKRTSSS